MASEKLTRSKVAKASDGMHGDGKGLYVQVTNGGTAKSWLFRWQDRVTKRDRSLGLGSAFTVDIEAAREEARKCRELLAEGKDPKVERDNHRLTADAALGLAKTVRQVADEYFASKIAHKSRHYRKQTPWILKNYLLDKIGDLPIQQVDTNLILNKVITLQHWKERNPIMVQVHNHTKRIFSLAIARGYYKGTNPAAWKDNLEHILPASKDVHKVVHRPALPYQEVGRFMEALRSYQDRSVRQVGHPTVALWLEFVVLTGARISEVRLATWNQIDLQQMVWNVPPENRKTGYVTDAVLPRPITKPMLSVLEEMQRRRTDMSPDALIFPSPYRGTPAVRRKGRKPHAELGPNTKVAANGSAPFDLNAAAGFIRKSLKWEIKIVPHGFRSTLVDWSRANRFPGELVHRQTDHVLGGKVIQAYGHDLLLEERRGMMELWAEYCACPAPTPATAPANVTQLSKARAKRRAAA
jgi:integrase